MPKGHPNPPLSFDLIAQYSERDPSGCLLWTGPVTQDGYARWKTHGKWQRVHRWVAAQAAEVPDGWTVDHQCHDPEECSLNHKCPHRRCVEPSHLRAMTNAENSLRGGSPLAMHARKTHCKRGHELVGDNVYFAPKKSGGRECRTCRVERMAVFYREKKT